MSSLDDITVQVETGYRTGNVLPLLHEIRHALERLLREDQTTVIDLGSIPLAPGEFEAIEAALGTGEVRAELDALGPSEIRETAFPGVWLITHRNANDEIAGRFIEVTRAPDILASQEPDIRRAVEALGERLADGETHATDMGV